MYGTELVAAARSAGFVGCRAREVGVKNACGFPGAREVVESRVSVGRLYVFRVGESRCVIIKYGGSRVVVGSDGTKQIASGMVPGGLMRPTSSTAIVFVVVGG